MSTQIGQSFATIVASFIMKKLEIDNSLFAPFHVILLAIFSYDFLKFETKYLSYFFAFGLVLFVCFLTYNFDNVKNYFESIFRKYFKDEEFLTVCDTAKTLTFLKYINNHVETKMKYSKICYSEETREKDKSNIFSPLENTKVYFYDKVHCMKGYFFTGKKYFDVSNDGCYEVKPYEIKLKNGNINSKISTVWCVEICLNKNKSLSREKYFQTILDTVKSEESKGKETLNNYKMEFNVEKRIDAKWITQIFNKNPSKCEFDHMADFFHQQKDELISMLEPFFSKENSIEKNNYGNIKQLGFLFHGPPGSGKSNIILRMANHLKRHIVTIDLINITKVRLWVTVANFCPSEDKSYHINCSKIIFAFDEFDHAIKMLKKREDLVDNKLLTLNDLLELFCGIVPFDGAIFVATTNYYDEIYEIKPALFRDGRLTPILFDHFDKNIIDQISEKYFGKKIGIEIKKKITNATIVNLAQKYLHDKNGFTIFQKKMTFNE
jgi:hypothetical protein